MSKCSICPLPVDRTQSAKTACVPIRTRWPCAMRARARARNGCRSETKREKVKRMSATEVGETKRLREAHLDVAWRRGRVGHRAGCRQGQLLESESRDDKRFTSGPDEQDQDRHWRDDTGPLILALGVGCGLALDKGLEDVIAVAWREIGQKLSEAEVKLEPAVRAKLS
jgi:hypothetical protein